ncbi:HK97 family phage prohead protease [Cryobacterium sp. MP_3.1]|uniref:HK97 family phage prohead protease n=1 Tax=Cryobacterium sp. MP_3.1 TaxID=3071711 RepID=UPI002E02F50D|nr:HK97 family phage prohead protease [Cryobacterium sp. MP_3.1]
MQIKQASASFKALTELDGEGIFEAIVSTYSVDSYGEAVMPGAFANTLAEWAASGDQIPCLWSHQLNDPFAHIGFVLEAKETDEGLWVKVQLDMENPTAQQTFRLLQRRAVKQFSFGFKVRRSSWGERDGHSVVELHEVELLEVSPTLVGANPDTQSLGVKAAALTAEIKAGKVLSSKNEGTVRAAYEALGELLAAVEPDTTKTDAKAQPESTVKTEEPSPVNVEEPPAMKAAHEAEVKSLETLIQLINIERLLP